MLTMEDQEQVKEDNTELKADNMDLKAQLNEISSRLSQLENLQLPSTASGSTMDVEQSMAPSGQGIGASPSLKRKFPKGDQ